jgi:hypothetical protein
MCLLSYFWQRVVSDICFSDSKKNFFIHENTSHNGVMYCQMAVSVCQSDQTHTRIQCAILLACVLMKSTFLRRCVWFCKFFAMQRFVTENVFISYV